MKREDQIRCAVRLIAPPLELAFDCKLAVEETIGLWGCDGGTWSALYELPPKKRKEAARKFRAALKRVIATSKAFPEGCDFFEVFEKERDELLLLADKYIRKCDRIIETPAGPPKRNANKKRWAAREALSLLGRYRANADRNTERQLAAILYGDPAADLRAYIREYKKPGPK